MAGRWWCSTRESKADRRAAVVGEALGRQQHHLAQHKRAHHQRAQQARRAMRPLHLQLRPQAEEDVEDVVAEAAAEQDVVAHRQPRQAELRRLQRRRAPSPI